MGRGRPRKNLLDNMIQEVDNTSVEVDESSEAVPEMNSPEWNVYVLSKLQDDEKDERKPGVVVPKTDGLGRLVRLLVGEIVESKSRIVSASPTYAVVEHTVSIKDWQGNLSEFTAVGDAVLEFTAKPYNRFLARIASTSARGRAYKDVLGLRNVTTAEEFADDIDNREMITSAQKVGINNLCKKLNINVTKFINMYDGDYLNLDEVTKDEASKLMAKLNQYSRGEENLSQEILNA